MCIRDRGTAPPIIEREETILSKILIGLTAANVPSTRAMVNAIKVVKDASVSVNGNRSSTICMAGRFCQRDVPNSNLMTS